MAKHDLDPTDSPLAHIAKWAGQKPDILALRGPNLQLTWLELNVQVHTLAAYFRDQRMTPGKGVVINATPELARIYALAVLEAGLFSVVSPQLYAPERLLDAGFRYSVNTLDDQTFEGVRAIPIPATLGANVSELGNSPRAIAGQEIVRVVLSSGTTGSPKAVPFTLKVLGERIRSASIHNMREAPLLNLLGFNTASGNNAFFLDMYRGSTHFIPGSPIYNLGLIQNGGIRGIACSPSSLELLVRAAEKSSTKVRLELATSVGGFLSEKLLARAKECLGCDVVNIFASTEAGIVTHSDRESTDPLSPGHAYPGVDVKIFMAEDAELGEGVGEVGVKTPYQVHEYLADSEETASRFRDGYFLSGDLGHVDDDGLLHLAGRSDDIINLHGQKINPHLIESEAISRFGLSEAVSVLATDQTGRQFHVMLVVADQPIDPIGIKQALYSVFRTSAPQLITQCDNLPKNEMGKVMRRLAIKVNAPTN